jgi:hypothetical protein
MKSFVALAALIFPALAVGQQTPPLNLLLDRLQAYASQYQAALPSLSCDELITSQALNKKGKVSWQIKIQSTLREIRNDDPYDPFLEKRDYKSVDGHRPKPDFPMPLFVEGGFANLVGFKSWEQRECFDYVLSPGDSAGTVRLEMTLKANPPDSSCTKIPAGFHRVVIADPESGRILHSERSVSPEVAASTREVYFGAVDYAPQTLGDQTFWLPARFYAHDFRGTLRMFATYSNYHRYTGEMKMLPGMSMPGAHPNPQ